MPCLFNQNLKDEGSQLRNNYKKHNLKQKNKSSKFNDTKNDTNPGRNDLSIVIEMRFISSHFYANCMLYLSSRRMLS